jgi:hypothetical protein
MNRRKWTKNRHSREEWLAKLMEEVGEVAREFTLGFDRTSAAPTDLPLISYTNLIKELDHVSFIAGAFAQAVIEGRITNG